MMASPSLAALDGGLEREPRRFRACLLLWLAMAGATGVAAAAPVELSAFTIYSPGVALQEPAGTFAMPITGLRYEPLVDVQARNLAEGQADVALRGGLFENTGFRLGGATLHDPQTGHYFAEIPVAPAMLAAPRILTGVENALDGFNANIGTIAFAWQPVRTRGELTVTVGQDNSYRASVYEGVVTSQRLGGRVLAADAEVSRSTADGSVPFGDHRFQRYAMRLQLAGRGSQTDLFYGYQAKFFGWPNLYTPFGSDETENLQTVLLALNHRTSFGPGDRLEASVFWRRNKDDYAFNRFAPVGPVHPYQHTTWTTGAAFSGHDDFGAWALGYSVQWLADALKSTSLIFGRFHSRTYAKAGVMPEKTWMLGTRRLTLKAGGTFDDTNREDSAVSPVAEIVLESPRSGGGASRLYFSSAGSTQVPTYTALNSSPAAGLFRGNPSLGRTTSHDLEIGCDENRGVWRTHFAAFYRRDDNLVDWTFQQGVVARRANPVNIGTAGVEATLKWSRPGWDVIIGYAYLHKNADYGTAVVAGSFYALNFPRQRLTAAIVAQLGGGFELRMDNQARIQEDNPLRTAGGNRVVISALGFYYRPPRMPRLDLSVQADNLWNSAFQAVPAVPAARREISAGIACRW
jgi:vitamin B12 transporter